MQKSNNLINNGNIKLSIPRMKGLSRTRVWVANEVQVGVAVRVGSAVGVAVPVGLYNFSRLHGLNHFYRLPKFFSTSVILKTSNEDDYDLSRIDKLLSINKEVVEDVKDLSNLSKKKISKSKDEILGEEYEKMSNYTYKYMQVLSKDKKVISKIGKEIKYDEDTRNDIQSQYKDTQEDTSKPEFLLDWLRAREKADNYRKVVSRNILDLIHNAMKKRGLNKNSQEWKDYLEDREKRLQESKATYSESDKLTSEYREKLKSYTEVADTVKWVEPEASGSDSKAISLEKKNRDENVSAEKSKLSSPTEFVQELSETEPMDYIDPDL